MDAISTRTKIRLWAVVGEKEKIDFDVCDFSADQVCQLDRMIRSDGDPVRLRFEAENKRLGIAPVVADVRLVSMACRTSGQKIKVADFTSSDTRAEALKRLCTSETPILLTIEEIQGHLSYHREPAEESETATEGTETTEIDEREAALPSGEAWGDKTQPRKTEGYDFKGKGLKQAALSVSLIPVGDDGWQANYEVHLGNYADIGSLPDDGPVAFVSRGGAIETLQYTVGRWLDGLTFTGGADHRRSMETRRDQMKEQVNAYLKKLANEA